MRRALLAAAAVLALMRAAGAQDLQAGEERGLRWTCGGVGAEERAWLARRRAEANLELLFVTEKRGGYLADAAVAVQRTGAGGEAVRFVADGPQCLLSVPPGRYRIEATLGERKRALEATAGMPGAGHPRLVFAFPGDPWDGIWASDEEKRQAREP